MQIDNNTNVKNHNKRIILRESGNDNSFNRNSYKTFKAIPRTNSKVLEFLIEEFLVIDKAWFYQNKISNVDNERATPKLMTSTWL